jgi:hypothetical protein
MTAQIPNQADAQSLAAGFHFAEHRRAALALLCGNHRLSRKAGQFLGQLVVDPSPMSEAQTAWLSKLLERNELPPMAEGAL